MGNDNASANGNGHYVRNGYPKGIFCLEGNWTEDLVDHAPVETMLRLLNHGAAVPFVHRDCSTYHELAHYLKKWTQRSTRKRFPILYFGFHGRPGQLQIPGGNGSRGNTTLKDLATILEGQCKGSIIYFGSCNTLNTSRSEIDYFLKKTGAAAVCGYRKSVNWMNSAIFELIAFQLMQEHEFSGRGIPAIERKIRKYARPYQKELSFRMVYRTGA